MKNLNLMIKKKKICQECKSETFIWSKNLCKNCFTKLNPPKKIQYKSAKQKIKDVGKANRTKELHFWFLEVWQKRREKDELGYFVRCYESGQKLYENYYKFNTCCYSHYYPKSRFPEYEFEEWNLEIIHPDQHTIWENDHSKCIKMYKKFNTELTKENLSLTKEN